MNFVELTGWAAMAIALVGVWLNNRRRRACFVMWLVSNAITFGIHVAAGMWRINQRCIVQHESARGQQVLKPKKRGLIEGHHELGLRGNGGGNLFVGDGNGAVCRAAAHLCAV